MRLMTVRTDDGTRAVRCGDGESVVLDAPDVGTLLREPGWRTRALHDGPTLATTATHPVVAPLIPNPEKIVCVGLNYRGHIRETGREQPAHPKLFAKWSRALIGAFDNIVLPAVSQCVDWEAELVVVVGAPVFRADRETAVSAIAGYTVGNDISARDWQRRTGEWLQGKTFESTTPLGPVLVTPDELPGEPGAPDLALTCNVNGELMQHARTSDLLFDPAALIAYASQIITLVPGDLIFTGTPAGIGSARRPARYLNAGDEVATSVELLGQCVNTCAADSHRPGA